MDKSATYWINRLGLQPHPEGGYYKESYRSEGSIDPAGLPEKYTEKRSYSTSIYFLLKRRQVSKFHRIKSDEIWHFHSGSPVIIHIIIDGQHKKRLLGLNPDVGEFPQVVIPAGAWFAAEVKQKDSFSLVGCTVAPGFEFDDFELANQDDLLKEYPDFAELIKEFT